MVPAGAKEKLRQEVEELRQAKEELEVRMSALKSQYDGRLLRQDRELRELRGSQVHSEPREEAQDQSAAKVTSPGRTTVASQSNTWMEVQQRHRVLSLNFLAAKTGFEFLEPARLYA